MMHQIYPGYENQYKSYLYGDQFDQTELEKGRLAQREAMMSYEIPEGMTIQDIQIDGPEEGQKLTLRIYKPGNLPEKAPVVMDVHGGGWVAGGLDTDNRRCIEIAKRGPFILVGVDYRLSGTPEVGFPGPLMDVYTAYQWILNHMDELGGNGCVGTHGSSAGANLIEGLALYLRDKGERQPDLTVLNCPPLDISFVGDYSYQQNFDLRMDHDMKAGGAEWCYLNGYNGTTPSYYAFPAYCPDLGMLKPHFILVGEYDTLRDGGLRYAKRLTEFAVPTELFMGTRSCHCWTATPGIYTDMTHDLIALAYKREFGMLDDRKV